MDHTLLTRDLEPGSPVAPSSTSRKPRCTLGRAVAAVICLVLVLLGSLAVLPLVVQWVVGGVPLHLNDLRFGQPNGAQVSATGQLHAPCFVGATAAAGSLRLLHGSQAVGTLDHGPLRLGGTSGFGGTLRLEGGGKAQPFVDMALSLLGADQEATLEGSLALTLPLGYKTTVHISKTLPLRALKQLPTQVSSFVLLPSAQDAVEMNCSVAVLDPSNVGLDLGVVELDLEFEGAVLGRLTTATSAAVFQGTTSLTLAGLLPRPDQTGPLSTLFSAYLRGEPSQLVAHGRARHGPLAPWADAIVLGLQMQVVLPGYTGSLTTSAALPNLGVDVRGPKVKADLVLQASLPMLRFPFSVATAGGQGGLGQPQAVGLVVPPAPVQWNTTGPGQGSLGLSFDLLAQVKNQTAFGQLLASSVMEKKVAQPLDLAAQLTVDTPLGTMTLTGLPISTPATFQGLDGLPGVTLPAIDALKGTDLSLQLMASTVMPNPTGLSLNASALPVAVKYQGQLLATTQLDPPKLGARQNVTATTALHFDSMAEQQVAVLEQLVSRYVQGLDTVVDVLGDADSAVAPPDLKPMLQALKTPARVQGLQKSQLVVQNATVDFDASKHNGSTAFKCLMQNPFSSLMRFTQLTATVRVNMSGSILIGQINHTMVGADRMNSPAKGREWSTWVPIVFPDALRLRRLSLLAPRAVADPPPVFDLVNTSFTVRLGDNSTGNPGFALRVVNYTQRNIPLWIPDAMKLRVV